MFGDDCRHCSRERTTTGEFTKIEKDPKTRVFVPKGRGRKVVDLGAYCNNVGKFVEDLHYCPARWSLYRGKSVEKQKVKSTKPDKKQVWKTKKSGPIERSAQIVKLGQQKLFMEKR
jgi:hypothetical protein